jgi:hypothetical protein
MAFASEFSDGGKLTISGKFAPTPAQSGLSLHFVLKTTPVPAGGGVGVDNYSPAGPVPSVNPHTAVRPFPAVNFFTDLVRRLRHSRAWVGAQFWAIFCFILAGIAWASAPLEPAWQASLFAVAPPLLAAAMLILQCITMRSLMGEDRGRAPLWAGCLALLAWAALVAAVWAVLVWCDRAVPLWAAWLSAHAHSQSTLVTPLHAEQWLDGGTWVLRWIVLPGAAVPCAMAAAQWGCWPPWRKIARLLFNWRWWPGVVLAALVGVALPEYLFALEPHGSILQQIAELCLKLAAAYILAVGGWVLLLGWAAALFSHHPIPPPQLVAGQPKPQIQLRPKAA